MKYILSLVALFAIPLSFVSAASHIANVQSYGKDLIEFINVTLVPFLFSLALIIFIYNVIQFFILDSDSFDKKASAKRYAVYSVSAFVLMVSIWGIVNLFVGGLGFARIQAVCPDSLSPVECLDMNKVPTGIGTFIPAKTAVPQVQVTPSTIEPDTMTPSTPAPSPVTTPSPSPGTTVTPPTSVTVTEVSPTPLATNPPPAPISSIDDINDARVWLSKIETWLANEVYWGEFGYYGLASDIAPALFSDAFSDEDKIIQASQLLDASVLTQDQFIDYLDAMNERRRFTGEAPIVESEITATPVHTMQTLDTIRENQTTIYNHIRAKYRGFLSQTTAEFETEKAMADLFSGTDSETIAKAQTLLDDGFLVDFSYQKVVESLQLLTNIQSASGDIILAGSESNDDLSGQPHDELLNQNEKLREDIGFWQNIVEELLDIDSDDPVALPAAELEPTEPVPNTDAELLQQNEDFKSELDTIQADVDALVEAIGSMPTPLSLDPEQTLRLQEMLCAESPDLPECNPLVF